jgi:HD superfamily phosphohydrolase
MRTYVRVEEFDADESGVRHADGRRRLIVMPQRLHEVRDPVHVFVHFDDDERRVIDSAPFQRLRHIHQLALTSLVYPGASHKRFEHSLGVMELAGRIYDQVTRPDKITDAVRDVVPKPGDRDHAYWRTVVRMAALCHDTGHLPFSHAAEDELLPDRWDHERITWEIVHSPRMAGVWSAMRPKPEPDDVAKIALGARKVERLDVDLGFSAWEAILAEIIVGEAFGSDRMDYLLRDSLHTGVVYGRFDHKRLIETLRVLRRPPQDRSDQEGEEGGPGGEPALGCERGGLQSAEALLLARYFMFAQVYYHPTRLAYDAHLKDFLVAWLPEGRFPTEVDAHVGRDDNAVLHAIAEAARDSSAAGHEEAKRIVERRHFKVAYESGPDDTSRSTRALAHAAAEHFDPELVRHGASPRRGDPPDFPVLERDGSSSSSLGLSEVLRTLPVSRDEYVLVDTSVLEEAKSWIKRERERIVSEALASQTEQEEEVTK